MELSEIKINYDDNKKDIIEAFVYVLGEQYRNIITQNLNDIVVIDYFTKEQLNDYLVKTNQPNSEDLEDEEIGVSIQYIKDLINHLSDNKIVVEQCKKLLDGESDWIPFYIDTFIEEYGEYDICNFVCEMFGKVPTFSDKEISSSLKYWDENFSEEETEMILDLSNKAYLECFTKKLLSFDGTKNIIKTYDEKGLDFNEGDLLSFDFEENTPSVFSSVTLKNKKVISVLAFPTLGVNNTPLENLLNVLMHELTHVAATLTVENGETATIKKGLIYEEYTRKTGQDAEGTLGIIDEERALLDEGITQYISTKVTQYILDKGSCENIFSFPVPKQKANYISGYINIMKTFLDFFTNNEDDIISAYIGIEDLDKIGNANINTLATYAEIANGSAESDLDNLKTTITNLGNTEKTM